MSATPQVVAIEVTSEISAIEPLYLSTTGFTTRPTDDPISTTFQPRLKGQLTYKRSGSCIVWERDQAVGTVGTIDIDNTDGALDFWFTEVWRNRSVVIKRGLETDEYADFVEVARCVVDSISAPNWYTIRLSLRDKGALLDVPLQSNLYPALTFAPGLQGTPRPVCIGLCEGVPLVLVNSADLEYDVHDDTTFDVEEVTDQGVILVEGVEWERSTESTTFGVRRLNNNVQTGKQVARVRGESNPGASVSASDILVTRLPDVIAYLLSRSPIDPGDVHSSVDALDVAAPYDLCLWDRSGMTIAQALTYFMDSFCGWWYFDRENLLHVGRLQEIVGPPVVELSDKNMIGDITPTLDTAPKLSTTLGCVRNWSPHKEGEVAGSVYDDDPERAQRIAMDQQVRASVLTPHPTYDHAVSAKPSPSLLSNVEDGQTEIDRRIFLFEGENTFYACKAALEGSLSYTLEPGDVVLVTVDRFGLHAGKLMMVVSVDTDLNSSVVSLILWGPSPDISDFASGG